MATAEMRKMLDSLMGPNRNGDATEEKRSYTDPDVCKLFLLGLCPHELFNNTKNDLGTCPLVHHEGLKVEYEEARARNPREFASFDFDIERELERVVSDCDKRIVKVSSTSSHSIY
eukprot:TRINITY_DN3542_c0_g1_i1.p1 TRINITY_DN3542_c0_g1~~TRINITY_DN3542_c0_g1_i1.p1  ORF type:complete len:126 (-),score=30.19 TRINITY_DN3542_c0_g1_i1:165-512(-)